MYLSRVPIRGRVNKLAQTAQDFIILCNGTNIVFETAVALSFVKIVKYCTAKYCKVIQSSFLFNKSTVSCKQIIKQE